MTQKPLTLQVANTCGKQIWPNLRNTDIFYLDWERHSFLMFPVKQNFCWKDNLQIPTHGISEMKYDPWQLLAEIRVVPTGLSAAHLLNSSCDFHDCVNFAQYLLPSLVWMAGMCLPSGSSFQVPKPVGSLACRAWMPGSPLEPRSIIHQRWSHPSADTSLLWWSHILLESSQPPLTGKNY